MPSDNKTSVGDRLVLVTLLQAVVYSMIWLWNEYVAFYITIILPTVILFLILLSAIADWIEPSRISGWYYKLMILSMAIPLVIGIVFYFVYGGRYDFLTE